MEKITYASLGNLGEDFHHSFEAALVHERKKFGDAHPMFINGKAVKASKTFIDFNQSKEFESMGVAIYLSVKLLGSSINS